MLMQCTMVVLACSRCLQTATYTADRLDKPILVEFGISQVAQA